MHIMIIIFFISSIKVYNYYQIFLNVSLVLIIHEIKLEFLEMYHCVAISSTISLQNDVYIKHNKLKIQFKSSRIIKNF